MNPEKTANEFVDVQDIYDIFLLSKSGYLFSYLRMYPFNLDLLPRDERRALTNQISAAFDSDRKNLHYCTFPRELDLDSYKNELKQRRLESLESLGRKKIIDCAIKQANELSSSRENFEHQHFYKIWLHKGNNRLAAEAELKERIYLIRNIYRDARIDCDVLDEKEIIKLCNLFGNRRSASYDVIGSTLWPEFPLIKE